MKIREGLRVLGMATVAGLLLGGLGQAAPGQQPPELKLKAPQKATTKRPPPSRPCIGDCVVPSKYKSYEGFLLWSYEDSTALWSIAFRKAGLGGRFRTPRYHIITSASPKRTRCNVQPALVRSNAPFGPFYCSVDGPGTIFMPTDTTKRVVFGFASDYKLRDYRLRDFAFSLVVAHEFGHHVQELLGYFAKKPAVPSIRIELQADCMAGLWAHAAWARSLLEQGDIAEGLRLASAIGDLPGTPRNDPSAHGTGAQRVQWFMRGYTSGRFDQCDTSGVRAG